MSIHVHVRQRNFGWAMGGRRGIEKDAESDDVLLFHNPLH